jgi:hypothetical protein
MYLHNRRQQVPSRYFAGRLMVATEVMPARSKSWTVHGREIVPRQQTFRAKYSEIYRSAAPAAEL